MGTYKATRPIGRPGNPQGEAPDPQNGQTAEPSHQASLQEHKWAGHLKTVP